MYFWLKKKKNLSRALYDNLLVGMQSSAICFDDERCFNAPDETIHSMITAVTELCHSMCQEAVCCTYMWLQIREGIREIFFLFFHKNRCCRYSIKCLDEALLMSTTIHILEEK